MVVQHKHSNSESWMNLIPIRPQNIFRCSSAWYLYVLYPWELLRMQAIPMCKMHNAPNSMYIYIYMAGKCEIKSFSSNQSSILWKMAYFPLHLAIEFHLHLPFTRDLEDILGHFPFCFHDFHEISKILLSSGMQPGSWYIFPSRCREEQANCNAGSMKMYHHHQIHNWQIYKSNYHYTSMQFLYEYKYGVLGRMVVRWGITN